MGWSPSSWKPLGRPSRAGRRAPRRNRPLTLEGLEGRRLPSQAVEALVTLPRGSSNILSGPDGDLWVAVNPVYNAAAIERIGPDGSVTSIPVPGNGSESMSIGSLATGPDGNIWFDIDFINLDGPGRQVVIGNVTPSGVVTEFPPVPLPDAGQFGGATSLVSGPDGALWFVCSDRSHDFIGRVTTAGAVALFPIASSRPRSLPDVYSLAAGADGNLWFAEYAGRRSTLDRMTPSGAVTRFRIPGQVERAQVADAPDGSLIVTGQTPMGLDEVFDATTAGALTREPIPSAIAGAFFVDLGPADGSLWFTTDGIGAFQVGRIAADGAATSEDLSGFVPGRTNFVTSMAVGQDGDLDLLDNLGGMSSTVYRVAPGALFPAS